MLGRGRGTASAIITAIALLGCGRDAQPQERGTRVGAEEIYAGELHACAHDLPVPPTFELVETARGRDQAGERTCVVTLRTGAPVPEATQEYADALRDATWRPEVAQADEAAGMLHLHGPLCGVVIVLPEDDRTSVMASVLDCDRARSGPGPTVRGEE